MHLVQSHFLICAGAALVCFIKPNSHTAHRNKAYSIPFPSLYPPLTPFCRFTDFHLWSYKFVSHHQVKNQMYIHFENTLARSLSLSLPCFVYVSCVPRLWNKIHGVKNLCVDVVFRLNYSVLIWGAWALRLTLTNQAHQHTHTHIVVVGHKGDRKETHKHTVCVCVWER